MLSDRYHVVVMLAWWDDQLRQDRLGTSTLYVTDAAGVTAEQFLERVLRVARAKLTAPPSAAVLLYHLTPEPA